MDTQASDTLASLDQASDAGGRLVIVINSRQVDHDSDMPVRRPTNLVDLGLWLMDGADHGGTTRGAQGLELLAQGRSSHTAHTTIIATSHHRSASH